MATQEPHDSGSVLVSPHRVDARGKPCPLPIIELARALTSHAVIELVADDPAAHPDLLAFAEATGHVLESLSAPGASPVLARVRRRA